MRLRAIAVGLLAALSSQAALSEPRRIAVDVWDPPFNTQHKHQRHIHALLARAERKWALCVAIPHLKDPYWLAVNYGLVDQARKTGVALSIHAAGGYDRLEVQRQQVEQCLNDDADALILAAINAKGLEDLIARFNASGKPVIDLINGVDSQQLTARTGADFFEMGKMTGDYIQRLARPQGELRIGWLPGPQGAGWAEAGNLGFRQAVSGQRMRIVDTAWGDTGLGAQVKLVARMLDKHPDIQLIAGTAISAEAAVMELRRRHLSDKVKVVSYYFAPMVFRGIARQAIVAAPSDVPGTQARLSIDVAIRALEGKPYPKHLGASPQMIDRTNLHRIDLSESLAPEGFRSTFSVNRSTGRSTGR